MEEKKGNELYITAIVAVVAVVAIVILISTGVGKINHNQIGEATKVLDSTGNAMRTVTEDGTVYLGSKATSTTISQLCTDSDGGYNILEKGIVQLYDASSNVISTYTDTCFDSKLNTPVYECENTGSDSTCTYEEFFCVDNNKDGIKETYDAMIPNPEDACPNGCRDGACLPNTE